MILARCPACQTVFRVRPEQLRARQGQVRCGNCFHAFNALETLVEDTATPAPDAPPLPPAATAVPSTSLFVLEEKIDDVMAEEPAPAALPPGEEPAGELPAAPGEEPSGFEPFTVAAAGDPAPEPFMRTDPAQDAEPAARPEPETPPPEPFETDDEADAPRSRAWLWSLSAGLLAIVLLAQTVLVFRDALARGMPDLRPTLAAICRSAGCSLPLPHEAELISIENSDLRPDSQHEGHYRLELGLKNRADFAQAYPHLELTLTDARDQPLVRRVFSPAEWLLERGSASADFKAHDEVPVKLLLAAPDIPAAGYRVYAFYP
ncbi:MAG: DUF3426 domain-containing protein [Zoogloea sp.]|nr:DUF3426 domain-containing protein [Zoogloea sp.]